MADEGAAEAGAGDATVDTEAPVQLADLEAEAAAEVASKQKRVEKARAELEAAEAAVGA